MLRCRTRYHLRINIMTHVNPEQKESVLKGLAVVGFLAAIILLVFIAVKVVTLIPSAFSSLASIADSVYNYENQKELVVETPNTVVNTGEHFTITWTNMKRPGTYVFSYTCTPGAAVDVRTAENDIVAVDCDTDYDLVKDQTTLDVTIATEKQRFTDVSYQITFIPSDPRMDESSTASVITIVNASIATSETVTETKPEPEKPAATPETPVVTPPSTPVVPKPKPQYVTQVVYSVPVSDPKGKIDLQITPLGIGTLTGATFTPKSTLETGEEGAIRFSIKNIGTKTADTWSYKAELPADINFTSGDQKALKPSEEAIITLTFTGLEKTGTETYRVTVSAAGDVASKNNETNGSVKVVK